MFYSDTTTIRGTFHEDQYTFLITSSSVILEWEIFLKYS